MLNLKALSVLIIFIITPLNIYAGNVDMKIKLNPAQFKEENLNFTG